jgi:hypothetical protein
MKEQASNMEFHLIPRYRSTNVIEALKIKEVHHSIKAGAKVVTIVPEDERFKPFDALKDSFVCGSFEPGEYWTRGEDGQISALPASLVEKHYQPATELTPELLKRMRSVVAKDLVSDEEISRLNQMVLTELHEENRGVIGGPDVIHMQHPARLAEAVTEMVLNKLAAMA